MGRVFDVARNDRCPLSHVILTSAELLNRPGVLGGSFPWDQPYECDASEEPDNDANLRCPEPADHMHLRGHIDSCVLMGW